MYRAYILSKSARSPRFRTERENWVQRVVADGHAICILPERSAAAPGLVTRPIERLFGAGIGDRDGLGIDHSGRDAEELDADLREVVRLINQHQRHRLVLIIDSDGAPAGLITPSDVVFALTVDDEAEPRSASVADPCSTTMGDSLRTAALYAGGLK